MLEIDEVYEYEGYFGCPSKCRVRLYTGAPCTPGETVVVMTELPDNPGTSITNRAEQLIPDLTQRYRLSTLETLFIEHYPAQPGYEDAADIRLGAEHFSTVDLREHDAFHAKPYPVWHYISKVDVEATLGERLED